MKTFLKVLTVIVLFLLALILILPMFFKAEIVELVKTELNKQVNARVDFEDADLSLIRKFPDFTLDLNKLSVTGKGDFSADTLLKLEALSLEIPVLKAFKGEFEIAALRLYKPEIKLLVNENGMANWDIATESADADTVAQATQESESVKVKLKEFRVTDGELLFKDESMNLVTQISGMELQMKGDLSADKSNLSTKLTARSFSLNYEAIPYFKDVKVRFNAMFLIDLANSIYTFRENELVLNDLLVNFEGSVGMNPDSYTLLLNFDAPESQFKQLISLVPALYRHDFEKLQANGSFQLDGFVKGTYSETKMPAYGLNLAVSDASFGYPDLPAKVEEMRLEFFVNNKTGETDDAIVQIKDLNWKLAEQPFRMEMELKTPESDPHFDMSASGTLDFEQVSALLPKEQQIDLKGVLQADFRLKGNMSAIEQNQFNKVNAAGSLVLQNFELNDTSMFTLPVKISNAQLNISPRFVDLLNTSISIGKSDMLLDGRIENYLPYVLSDGTLSGNLVHQSNLLDVDELMSLIETDGSDMETVADTGSFTLELPRNLVFDFESSIERLLYKPYELISAKAKVHYENQEIVFENLSANLLDGSMKMNGVFAALEDMPAALDMDFALTELDIPKAWETIDVLKQTVPVARQANGKMSAKFKVSTSLDAELSPLYETMQGGGSLTTSQLSISNLSSLQKLNTLLGTQQFDKMVTDGLNISFEFINGRVYQKPFNIKLGGQEAVVSGSTGFDQTIDFDVLFKVPYGNLGSSVQNGINELAGLTGNAIAVNPDEKMQIKAKMTGTTTEPVVKIDYKDYASNLKKQIENQVNQKIEEEKEKLREQAKEEAEKILSEAQQRADNLIAEANAAAQKVREEGKSAAQKVRDEANKQADKVVEEGKKKGMIAEMAAKEAAKKIRSEAENQAKNIEKEANQRADQIESKAQQQAASIMQQAQQKADKL